MNPPILESTAHPRPLGHSRHFISLRSRFHSGAALSAIIIAFTSGAPTCRAHSPLPASASPLITHHSSLTTHHSPLTAHHSPLTTHHSPSLPVSKSPLLRVSRSPFHLFTFSPLLLFSESPSLPVSKSPGLPVFLPSPAAYRWGAANPNGGAKANVAYTKWLHGTVVWAEDFEPSERWDNNIEGGDWQLGEWSTWKKANPARRLILSVPLLPGGWDRSGPKSGLDAGKPVSFEAGARGDYNEHFKALAQNLVRFGLDDTILRLGWEFNGGWYTWRASDNPDAFAAYWRQIVTTMRAIPGANKLKFCWNPALGWLQFPAEKAWPGDDVVDLVGLDVYDSSWAKDTYPWPDTATPAEIESRRQKVWNEVLLNGDHGLVFWKSFAAKHHRPFSIPEWGVSKQEDKHGGGDDPAFITHMFAFINDAANNVTFQCYFDVQAGDGHHQLSPGVSGAETTEFPRSAAEFEKLCSAPGSGLLGAGRSGNTVALSEEDNGKTVSLPLSGTLVIWLPSNPTTGYRWAVTELDKEHLQQQGNDTFEQPKGTPVGRGGFQVYHFSPASAGQSTLQLGYLPPGKQKPERTFQIQVSVGR